MKTDKNSKNLIINIKENISQSMIKNKNIYVGKIYGFAVPGYSSSIWQYTVLITISVLVEILTFLSN